MIHKHYIDGKWVESSRGETFESLNPATGEVLGVLSQAGPKEVEAAVEAAARAFPSWRRFPAPKRGEILFRVAGILAQRKEELATLMTREMGKVLKEARGDVQEGIDMTYYMAAEGRRQFGQVVPAELPDKFSMAIRDPIGVVAAITPWNFPLAIPTWKLMPALITGNTAVLKPAEDTPLMACKLVEIFEEAGLPPGVLNLVLGAGDVGAMLVDHPKVNLISFTGSNDVGREIAIKAASSGKRVALEMGGKNAILVMADANLDLALDGIVWSSFGTSGQRCTAASRIIVHRDAREELAEKLVERVRALRLGNGLLETTDVGPVINQAQLDRIHGYTEVGVKEGAELLTGGKRYTEGECAKGFFYMPTLFNRVKPGMRIAREEIFGPTTALIEVSSIEEAIEVNNATSYGLSSAIYTRDIRKAFQAIQDITTGIVYINAGTIGAEIQLPFGGTRGTGNGHREAGTAALETYTEWKTVYIDYSGRLQRAQID
ncbi:MAG: aldehyde dehydrogenase family protein [Nitrospinae bacterium]|nr:aldehyde dehydrogenase family protein [Nitrospinota bacterium]